MPTTAQTLQCLCEGARFDTVFVYTTPPEGETKFPFSAGTYHRTLLRCSRCGHFLSVHEMDTEALYAGTYVSATYGDDGFRRAFERIIALDLAHSDNAGRVKRILEFAGGHFGFGASAQPRSVLDVGSGLCVFLHRMKAAGWRCTALDPDLRAVRHAREVVGVEAVCGDFLTVRDIGSFDLIAFNKVLEHVHDPVVMLAKSALHLQARGVVYVELPDGEAAISDGPGREEFCIEHWHAFSASSVALLAQRAGFHLQLLERVREPSGKYTFRAFLTIPRH